MRLYRALRGYSCGSRGFRRGPDGGQNHRQGATSSTSRVICLENRILNKPLTCAGRYTYGHAGADGKVGATGYGAMWTATAEASTGGTLTITRGSTGEGVTSAATTYVPGEMKLQLILTLYLWQPRDFNLCRAEEHSVVERRIGLKSPAWKAKYEKERWV